MPCKACTEHGCASRVPSTKRHLKLDLELLGFLNQTGATAETEVSSPRRLCAPASVR